MTIDVQNPFLDKGIWPKLIRHDDDIIIATYAKFGRLRMQVMIDQLLRSSETPNDRDLPWTELRHPRSKDRIDQLNKTSHRRILRTHLNAKDIYRETGKYIYVGRDPRDLVWNLFHVLNKASDGWHAHFTHYGFSKHQADQSFINFWGRWIENDGLPFWPYFSHLQSWWKWREKKNVLFLHFLDFKRDMEGTLAQITDFLNIDRPQTQGQNFIDSHSFNHITQSSLLDEDMNSPMWNGGVSRQSNPRIGWNKHLNQKHEDELLTKLTASIGDIGAQWVLFGSN